MPCMKAGGSHKLKFKGRKEPMRRSSSCLFALGFPDLAASLFMLNILQFLLFPGDVYNYHCLTLDCIECQRTSATHPVGPCWPIWSEEFHSDLQAGFSSSPRGSGFFLSILLYLVPCLCTYLQNKDTNTSPWDGLCVDMLSTVLATQH